MKGFNWQLRALSLLAVGAVLWLGCGDNGTGSGGGGGGGSYESVTIGGKKWMKKNLNVSTADSWCYDYSTANCNKYGRLYSWSAAKSACQSVGWRLPTRADWEALAAAVGGVIVYEYERYWYYAGTALKSTSGWSYDGNGTDSYGFSALPGGWYTTDVDFIDAGRSGFWWTATEYSRGSAYGWRMFNITDGVDEFPFDVGYGLSVRCVKN